MPKFSYTFLFLALTLAPLLGPIGLKAKQGAPCPSCLFIKVDSFRDSLGLIQGDELVSIDGKALPASSTAALNQLRELQKRPVDQLPPMDIKRFGKPALLISCLAIPAEAKRLRALATSLERTAPSAARTPLLSEFQKLLSVTLPRAVFELNFASGEDNPDLSSECRSKAWDLCQANPEAKATESQRCPFASILPLYNFSSGYEDGVPALELRESELKTFYQKIREESESEYYRLKEETASEGDGWPRYIQQLTDDQGCKTYGQGFMAKACFGWSRYQKSFPNSHQEDVTREVASSCENLIAPTCVCERSIEPVLREAHAYLGLDSVSPNAQRVREFLKSYPKVKNGWNLGCTPGSEARPYIHPQPCVSVRGENPPKFLEEFTLNEASELPYRLILFKQGQSCSGSLNYGAIAESRIYIDPITCNHPLTELRFNFHDPAGVGQIDLANDGTVPLTFAGSMGADGSLSGKFSLQGSPNSWNVVWKKAAPPDSIHKEVSEVLQSELPEEACGKVQTPAQTRDLLIASVQDGHFGPEGRSRIIPLLCPNSGMKDSYFYTLLERWEKNPKERNRLMSLLNQTMFFGNDPQMMECVAQFVMEPKTATLKDASFDLMRDSINKVLEVKWHHEAYVNLIVDSFSKEAQRSQCIPAANPMRPPCQKMALFLQSLLTTWEKSQNITLPQYADKQRAEREGSYANKLRSFVAKLKQP